MSRTITIDIDTGDVAKTGNITTRELLDVLGALTVSRIIQTAKGNQRTAAEMVGKHTALIAGTTIKIMQEKKK